MKHTYNLIAGMTSFFKMINKKALFISGVNTILMIFCYFMLYKFEIITVFPNDQNIVSWDAVWYNQIRESGYRYLPFQVSNMAFFPLFSLFWKVTQFSSIHVSIFNAIIFMISFSLLIGKGKFKTVYLLVLVSLPCFIFFYLPYTEALFFLFGTFIIMGYRNNSMSLLIIGIFGCCLTRAVSTVFIPILILTELFCWDNSKDRFSDVLKRVFIYCAVALLCILIVVLIQGVQTDKWFYYIEAVKYYDRHLIFPSIPFSTYSPEMVLGIDGIAWVLGIIAMSFCLKWGMGYMRNFFYENGSGQIVDRSVCFSALFLSSVVFLDTFFTNNIGNSTNIWSINRHLLCTPFAIYFINWFRADYNIKKYDIYSTLVILILGLFITGIFKYPHHIIFYFLFSTSLIVSKFINKASLMLFPMYIFNLVLFAIFYYQFLSVKWIG